MGQSRNEDILENILGAQNPLGEPQSREEALLMQILEQGGGGGSSTTVLYSNMDDSNLTIFRIGDLIPLSQSIEQFDALIIIGGVLYSELTSGKRITHFGNVILSKDILLHAKANYGEGEYGHIDILSNFVTPSYYGTWCFKVPDSTHFYISQKNTSGWIADRVTINKIVGIKY